MTLSAAPLFDEIAAGPAGGRAVWVHGSDGVRIRLAHWPADGAKGTVFFLPGRTEYIEKYGPAAADLAARGYGMVAIDWRGQGLGDRALPDPLLGHVIDFAEFQRDIQAAIAAVRALGAPEPFFLMGHSMGGCIGLRALHDPAAPFRAAAFSAPMWGIRLSPAQRRAAHVLTRLLPLIGLGNKRAPGTSAQTYVAVNPFEDNTLTTDPEMYRFMVDQAAAHPELTLGGPTVAWLRAALRETEALAALPAPDVPMVTFLGTNERIVAADPVHARAESWPDGALEMVNGAEHEIVMETPATRAQFFDAAAALFDAHL